MWYADIIITINYWNITLITIINTSVHNTIITITIIFKKNNEHKVQTLLPFFTCNKKIAYYQHTSSYRPPGTTRRGHKHTCT